MSRTGSNNLYAWTAHVDTGRSYTSNALNQYTQIGSTITPTYDAKGNMTSGSTSGAGVTYGYNVNNMLVSSNSGAQVYPDPIGRMKFIGNGTMWTRMFDYDGAQIAEWRPANMSIQHRYVYGPGSDEALVWYDYSSGSLVKKFLTADERGSVVAVTGSSGAVVNINSYDEYGIPASGNVGMFQYTGQAWLPELGMYSYKARIYSPTLGRFMQTDPVGYGDGMNWYDYVGGDPINGTDPSGLADVKKRRDANGKKPWVPAPSDPLAPVTIIVTGRKAVSPSGPGSTIVRPGGGGSLSYTPGEAGGDGAQQNVIPMANCRASGAVMDALGNQSTQDQARNMVNQSGNYNGSTAEHGYTSDPASGAVGPLFTSGLPSRLLPPDYLSPSGAKIPMVPGAGAGMILWHGHPNAFIAIISTDDQRSAEYYKWSAIVAVDKYMKADCYVPGGQ